MEPQGNAPEGSGGPMVTSASAAGQANKVVVAFLDGRRLKGYVFNFSALRELFRLFPEERSGHEEGKDVAMKDLKAVFFVKTFVGNPEYHESDSLDGLKHGRRVEVTFPDGEKIVGSTEGYNPQKLGFYVFPADPKSNNIRVFVVNKNTERVRLV
jgi:hypothetical protein